jgi:hypothetical protein
MACTARIGGTEGWIDLPAFMHCPGSITVHRLSGTETIETGWEGEGLQFEIEEVHRCLAAGATESQVMPLDESVALMAILDDIRAQVGVTYPS